MFNWVCPRCGHDVPPSKTECPFCALSAQEPVAAQPPAQPYQAPPPQQQYAPPQQYPPPGQPQYWQPPTQYPQAPPQQYPPQQTPYGQQAPQQYWQPPAQNPPASPQQQYTPPQYPPAPQPQYAPPQYQPPQPPQPIQQEPAAAPQPQYTPPPYQPAQQYQPQEAQPQQPPPPPPQPQYQAPPQQQYTPPAPVSRQPEPTTPWPPPEQQAGRPAWQLGLLAFIGVIAIFGIAYYLMSSHGSSAAKDATKQQTTDPMQKYIEVVGIRLVTDKSGAQAVRFLVVNHSGVEMTDLAANVNLWASTQRSEEDSVGSFTFHVDSLAANESKELTAPLKTDKPPYDQPEDWRNITADVQVNSTQTQ